MSLQRGGSELENMRLLMLAAARGDDTGHTTPLTPAVAAAGKVFHEKRCGPLQLFGSRGGVAAAGVRGART
jgi:hypothetical protein